MANKVTLKSVFRRVDKNDDKSLSEEEVNKFIKDAGVGSGWLGGAKAALATKGFMDKFDTSKDGTVGFDEFVSKSRSLIPKTSGGPATNIKTQASAFAGKADQNKDGAMDRGEIAATIAGEVKRKGRPMAETIGDASSKLSVALFDENQNNKVDREELESLAEDIQRNIDNPSE